MWALTSYDRCVWRRQDDCAWEDWHRDRRLVDWGFAVNPGYRRSMCGIIDGLSRVVPTDLTVVIAIVGKVDRYKSRLLVCPAWCPWYQKAIVFVIWRASTMQKSLDSKIARILADPSSMPRMPTWRLGCRLRGAVQNTIRTRPVSVRLPSIARLFGN